MNRRNDVIRYTIVFPVSFGSDFPRANLRKSKCDCDSDIKDLDPSNLLKIPEMFLDPSKTCGKLFSITRFVYNSRIFVGVDKHDR